MPAIRSGMPGLAPGGRVAEWSATSIGLVALDVDGTLVRESQVPEQRILDAVRDLASLGVKVGLSTGRMSASSLEILNTGVLTGPHVFNNGAVITDGDGEELHVLGLTDDEVDAVLDMGRGHDDVWVEIYLNSEYLTDRVDPRSGEHVDLLGVAPTGLVARAADLEGRPVVKAVMVCLTPEATTRTLGAVDELGLVAGPAGSPATPDLRFVNITRAGVHKGTGVEAAARTAGLRLAEVVSIGDETNDIPALSRAGTAIAMGDADAEVRAHAHFVAPPFHESGAAVALESLRALLEA